MTRINVGIDPCELPDRLLLAEHREITRIPNAVRSGRAKIVPQDRFTLGTGHVRFFYTRLGYLKRRYTDLFNECKRRGFRVTDKRSAFDGLTYGEYTPTDADRQIILERITSKGFTLETIPR